MLLPPRSALQAVTPGLAPKAASLLCFLSKKHKTPARPPTHERLAFALVVEYRPPA